MILTKLEENESAITQSGNYQHGFKRFRGTHELIAHVDLLVLKGESFIYVDFTKAFVGINRKKFCELLRQVAKQEGEITSHCVELIINLLQG